MARAPFQVLVFPYRQVANASREYCLFRRADNGLWQGVAGGGEDAETPLQAAIRECWEEARIPPNRGMFQLDSVEAIPATLFAARAEWGAGVYVIPQYTFGVEMPGQIVISNEHTEYQWMTYQDAILAMRYDGDKTALWELDQRLKDLAG